MSNLSLCIPAFNAAKHLPRLLSSAFKQKIPFDEVLIYDDCSVDNTSEVGTELGATIIRGEKNIGCSASKNELAKVAKSEWLFFIDADDELYSNFTLVANDWMEKIDSADIVLMRYRYIDFITNKILDEPFYDADELKRDAIKYTIKNKIVNFELIKKAPFLRIGGFDLDPKVLYIEDRAFALKASINGLSFDAEKEITCIKYHVPRSMSSANMDKWPEAGFHLWSKTLKAVGRLYPFEISEQLYQNAIWAAKANSWSTVKKSIQLAKKIRPYYKPNGSGLFQFFFKLSPYYAFYFREMTLRKVVKNKHP